MRIDEIEGMSSEAVQKLSGAGVRTVEALLERASKPGGRAQLAASTGISAQDILRWVNRADLMRLRGVGREYADLLEASGVDSCLELSHRRADHLHAKLEEVNAARKLVQRIPTMAELEAWITEAKSLPAVVEH
jgi:transposase